MSRPRIRYIKPEIWLSRDFRALTPIGRLTFMALISNADDDGRLKTDPAHLSMTYLPGCEPYEIATQLEAMEERRMVIAYSVRGVHYVALLGWSAHQRVSHYVKSDLPEPPKFKRGGIARTPRQLSLGRRVRQTYFMLRSDNQVKIGTSRDVASRKLKLESAAGPLTLLAATSGGYSESWYRKTFASLHTHGEWFRYEEPLCSHIAELIAGSENNESDSSHKGQNEIGILVRPTDEVSSPARLRTSANGLVPTSSPTSSPTTEREPMPDAGTALALVREPKGDVDAVFEAWKERWHPTAKLTTERRTKIQARLREKWTVEDLILAVTDGAAADPWENRHVALNDDLAHLLRNSTTVEKFVGLARRTLATVPAPKPHRLDQWAADVMGGSRGKS